MKLKKIMLMTAMAAAIGSVNMVSALADETATGETKFGWECDANNNWRYYNADGNLATGWIKAEEGDGRGKCGMVLYRSDFSDHGLQRNKKYWWRGLYI